mgnify:FL=1
MMMDISPDNPLQLNLFDSLDRKKHDRLMQVIDKLNSKYGRNSVSLAAQGDGKKWWIRQEKLPPYWSTRLSDLPVAN